MPRKRTLPLLAAAALATSAPAAAQMDHSKMPGMSMPMPAKKAPAKKAPVGKAPVKRPSAKNPVKKAPANQPAARKAVAKKPTAAAGPRKPASQTADLRAGHDMSAMPEMAMPAAAMPAHDMSAMDDTPTGTALPAGNAPPPPVPADHAGDAVYGEQAMDMGRHHLAQFHGGQRFFYAVANILETRVQKGRDGYEWDAESWYGGDINRLTVSSEGEGAYGRPVEKAEVQALYSRAIGPYFWAQGGVRYDVRPSPSRVYATVAVEGLAPSFFDVEGALFLSDKGELMARATGWYDQRITQRLILQPRAELNFAAQSSPDIAIGSGLSDAELGLRLRYDIRREFAPYVGLSYRRAFGETRRFLEAEGERGTSLSLVAGVRLWF